MEIYETRLKEAQETISQMKHDMEDHAHGKGSYSDHVMKYGKYEIENPNWKPSVNLEVYKDPKSGWNVYIKTLDFAFDPALAGMPHKDGVGHGYLYIDGKQISRVYSDWFYIDEQEPGEHEIKVSLSTNDNRILMLGKKALEANATIIQD